MRAPASAPDGPPTALRPLDTAIEILSRGKGASVLPELYLLKGDLLAALPAADGGGPAPGRGLVPARDRSRRRSSMPGCRTCGRRPGWPGSGTPTAIAEPPRASLGPIYATFTEGFATADLVEARDLLAVLPTPVARR